MNFKMITQQQIKQLEPLTQHLEFGPVLIRAIETWKTNNIRLNNFGITYSANQYYEVYSSEGCCLIGASIIGLKFENNDEHPFDCVRQFSNLSNDECYSLIDGFDGVRFQTRGNNYEAYNFARQVRLILNVL